jgi:hypothetical protein
MLQQYFDARTGRPLSEEEALKDGILRDGAVKKVRMVARDSKMPSFFDAALHRPGFRLNKRNCSISKPARNFGRQHSCRLASSWLSQCRRWRCLRIASYIRRTGGGPRSVVQPPTRSRPSVRMRASARWSVRKLKK